MPHDLPHRLLRARWVFPIDQPPLANGLVEIHGDQIIEVRTYRAGDQAQDLGDVALLPGLVNAHTHLEFSGLAQPLGEPQMPFPDWIRRVIEHRRQESADASDPLATRSAAVQAGIEESHAAGVAVLGEIATSPWPDEVINAAPQQIVAFAELLGLAPERQSSLWEAAQQHIAAAESGGCRWRAGISPHAPYTVHPELLAKVCAFSPEKRFPVAMHLAESMEEIELLLSGSGRLAELLQEFKALPGSVLRRGSRPLAYLQVLASAHRALVVHGNFLSGEEIDFAGQRSDQLSIVYCPRTHAYFCAGQYPLADMLAANVNVCLGTDSRASNPDLHLFEEMRFVALRHPDVTLEGILYLGTQAGADALGLGDTFGSIAPGKSAKLTVLKLDSTQAADPHELLFLEGTRAGPLEMS